MTRSVTTMAERGLRGRCRVPGDKSISHRAALLALLTHSRSEFCGYSPAGDCQASLAAVRALGGEVRRTGDRVLVVGPRRNGPPRLEAVAIDCGRSGTTMRLLAGIVAGWDGRFLLDGDRQLRQRPMARVARPLQEMGAMVTLGSGGRPPLLVAGGCLVGIRHRSEVASAQVKSAVLLAGIMAEGTTVVEEPLATRDHTERMLRGMGADISVQAQGPGATITVARGRLEPVRTRIPGDASSAAVVAAAAALVPGSDIVMEGVSLNPTRVRFFELLRRMGGEVEMTPDPAGAFGAEPAGSVRVVQRPLESVLVDAEEVPFLIDELPLVGLLATQAHGVTEVSGAAELRVKESDRIHGLVLGLRALGATVEERADGFSVEGPSRLRGVACDSQSDHRLAMTFTVAGLVAEGQTEITGTEYIPDSFPGFFQCLASIS